MKRTATEAGLDDSGVNPNPSPSSSQLRGGGLDERGDDLCVNPSPNLNLGQLRGAGLGDSGVNLNPDLDLSLGTPGDSGDSGAKRARARALVAELARAVWEVPDRWPIGNRLLEHFDRGDGKRRWPS